jgi:hypothetical protein
MADGFLEMFHVEHFEAKKLFYLLKKRSIFAVQTDNNGL